MKLLVVVTVLLTCGSYEELLKYIKNLPLTINENHVNSWFLWIKGHEEAEVNHTSSVNPTQRVSSIKYTVDIAPSIPRDNSHYVEGRSQYIWMPDGRGEPHLVDLWEALDDEDLKEWTNFETEYWLYTRKNPDTAQELNHLNSISNSNFNRTQPIIVIVHGWLSDGHDNFSTLMKTTFLSVIDGNIVIVDWRDIARSSYGTAVHAVPEIGKHIARFLTRLIDISGASWSNVHLIGFSLGAHIAGRAGWFAEGRPGRVTGLDPAGPLFHGNPDNLSPYDAQYVEVIHTDGDRLGHFGRLGQADFYVNGGRNPQPECFLSTCSHKRVVDLFLSSLKFNHLAGRRCASENEVETECIGAEMKMGNTFLNKRGSGIYSVKTTGIWPF